jgi:hypothetical membrane protein
VVGSLRPSYSHSTNGISELGALGTPHALLWNVVGFIGPGVLLAITGKAIADSFGAPSGAARIAGWLLVAFGLTAAGQGLFPASMTGGRVLVTWHTQTHLIVSLISGVTWIAAMLVFMAPMKRDSSWRGWHFVNAAVVLLVIANALIASRFVPYGLAQRLGDAIVFGWFAGASLNLVFGRSSGPGAEPRADAGPR